MFVSLVYLVRYGGAGLVCTDENSTSLGILYLQSRAVLQGCIKQFCLLTWAVSTAEDEVPILTSNSNLPLLGGGSQLMSCVVYQ